ncbi:MAG: molybdopterin-dependent oxidoreductase [Gammaproteobacteria bacterium]|jgi:isoquinoline 1-oxidoreductase beta subunit
MMNLKINGQEQSFDGDPETPLLWVLRDDLNLTGTKFGCGVGICGICTVLLDGEANHACMVPVKRAAGHDIATIEGLTANNHALIHAWIEQQVPQCGYCQPGQVMAAAGLLNQHADPTEDQVNQAMNNVMCRCGTYQRIRCAIHRVTKLANQPLPELQIPPVPGAGIGSQDVEQGVILDKWIQVNADNTVTITINHSEMGQGALTGLVMLVAEELDIELSQVRTRFAPAATPYRNPLFDEQTTGGSTSIRGEWKPLRLAGARARQRLMKAAASRWGVSVDECRTSKGFVHHVATQRRIDYGELAPEAAKIRAKDAVPLKQPDEFQLLGRPQPRLEIPAMVTGNTIYGADVNVPGMMYASIERQPCADAALQSVDASQAKAVEGVIDVVTIHSGVAVLARSNWAAIQGRHQLEVKWQQPDLPDANNETYHAQLKDAVVHRGDVVNKQGNAARALQDSEDILERNYDTSFLAHATLEPMNCTAHITEGRCKVWVGTQSQEGARDMAARVSGVSKNHVDIYSLFLGGGFGRRLEADVVADAVALAKQTGKPVQVLWSRADDVQHDFYRPAHVTALKASLNAEGRPDAWWQRSAGSAMALDMMNIPYKIPNFTEEQVILEPPLPVGAWRSVAAGQCAFVSESFIDELADAAGKDPLEYRFQLLDHEPRAQTVLRAAADKAGWGKSLPGGYGQGIALYFSFGSWVAQIAEVSVDENKLCIHRIVSVVDCGQVVNPAGVHAQIEGGIAMGLSAALIERVLFNNGKVTQSNLEDYPILKFTQLPTIESHIITSQEPPGGVGEPGLPPAAPAVANAIFAATGKRLRSLPMQVDLMPA